MHIHHDHVGGHSHAHTHEHTHADGVTHSHEHCHDHDHSQGHTHHDHDQLHGADHAHEHTHECAGSCGSCAAGCKHTPMEELLALMKYMIGHNAAHANELAQLATQLEQAGSHMAYEQVMAAVSDFEKGNMRLSAVLASLDVK